MLRKINSHFHGIFLYLIRIVSIILIEISFISHFYFLMRISILQYININFFLEEFSLEHKSSWKVTMEDIKLCSCSTTCNTVSAEPENWSKDWFQKKVIFTRKSTISVLFYLYVFFKNLGIIRNIKTWKILLILWFYKILL